MSYANADALVDTQWVADHLDDPNVRIVDGSWHLPPTGRDGLAEYQAAHIPGAVHFDIDTVSDKSSPLPHMMPTPGDFATAVGTMGIGNQHKVVVYDSAGLLSGPRVWWMFRVFGHDDVALMQGGFRKWQAEGRPVTSDATDHPPADFQASFREGMVKSLEDVRQSLLSGDEHVVDARAANRFAGSEPEFRQGVEAGHIPSSANLPYGEIVDAETGTYRDAETLSATFAAAGIDERPVITTCGSGVSACILGLGMHLLGNENWSVYDGSWTEWGSTADTPKAKGQA